MLSTSVQAAKTSSRVAGSTRRITTVPGGRAPRASPLTASAASVRPPALQQMTFQGVEPRGPEGAVVRQPRRRLVQRLRLDGAVMPAADDAPPHQPGAFQHF